MCVFLCANPKVNTWLDMLLAQAQRQSTSLSFLCPADPYDSPEMEGCDDDHSPTEPTVARSREVVSHTRWHQPIYHLYRPLDVGRASAHEGHKPLEALANAWSRLLILVGWRR